MASIGGRLVGMALGAVAGVAATWIMGRVTSWMYEREDPVTRQREDDVRGGRTSYEVAAQKLAGLAGRDLDDEQVQRAGTVLHWAIGITAGAVYGLLRARRGDVGFLRGLALGAGFFVGADEVVNTAFGFAPAPQRFPWQTHARGLAGHLTWGLATEAGLAALSRPLVGRRNAEA